MTEAAFWWVNTVQVATFLGTTVHGDRWAAPIPVLCWVEAGSKLVLDSSGNEVVSTSAVHGPLEQAGLFTVGTRVTVAGASTPSRVLLLDRFDSGSLGLGIEHFVAHLN